MIALIVVERRGHVSELLFTFGLAFARRASHHVPHAPAIRTVYIGSFPMRSLIGIMKNIGLGIVTSERITAPASDRLTLAVQESMA